MTSTVSNEPTADNMQFLLDQFAIRDVVSNYAAGLDARDWELWRSVFLDEVEFDLSSWTGLPPRALDTDRVVKAQARQFAELEVTQHFMTNHRIWIDGDTGRVVAHMRAEHWIAGQGREGTERYTMFGYYDHKLVRTDGGWKIARMQLNVTRTEGNRWVMEESQRRANKKHKG